jgi:tetratricopeptide (TPR) repeat protein
LEDTLAAIDRQNFLAQMSEGYKALQAEDFAAALSAFAKAKALDNSDLSVQSAQQAIAETQSRQQQMAIDRQMGSAAKFAQQEQWQQAQQIYRQLLEDDPSLVDAKAKLIPVEIRAQLDKQLVSLLDDPLALADKAIYSKATAWLADAQGIANPGPRLQNQIQQLEILIQRATLPISVPLVSDNQTEVTIYRVGKLGTFARQTVALTPGRYTIVGSRRGYRDMRIELTLRGEAIVEPVIIRCTEKI